MFRLLESLDADSAAYRRQRDAIIERTLPLAKHVAYRFRRRGEAESDLTQVACVGLINAVDRFDPATVRTSCRSQCRPSWGRCAGTSATSRGQSKFRAG